MAGAANRSGKRRHMPVKIADSLRGCAIALGSLAAALILRALADPWLGPTLPYATMFGAVALAVWFGGVGPAFFVTVVGYYATTAMFLREPGVFLLLDPKHLIGLALYLMSCLIIIGFGSALRLARHRAVASAESLRRSEHLYRAIGESINYGIWVCDPQGRNIYASDSFLRLVGLTQEECSSSGWMQALHPDDAKTTAAAWAECVRRGIPWEREHRFKGVDGRWHHVLARGVPIRGEGGAVTHWAGINLDISDLKKAQEALQEADRRKNEFLATLAHELRNPLAAIRNVTRLLQSREGGTPEARWSGEVVERQVRHLARLVDDLLDVSRITRGKFTLRREPVLLSAVVRSALETSRHAIDEGRHHLRVLVPDEPLFVDGDLTRLAQALENLLSNAAKYTPPGGHIEVAARADGGQAILTVTDDGVGIPPSMLSRVFDMFTQVEAPERSSGGLGIGLTLVKRLVEMHGGTVAAHSDGLGRGSRFELRLPLAPPRGEPLHREERLQPMPSPRRILVVDDNRDAADSLVMLLQGNGHEVQTAYDGEEALRSAAAMRPDIILMDLGLPGLSGYDVARRLRAQPWGNGMMLVALTGWGQEEDRRRSREVGFDLHMVKPLDLEALHEALAPQA
jgi:two-component system CheB/CheR fusion protein